MHLFGPPLGTEGGYAVGYPVRKQIDAQRSGYALCIDDSAVTLRYLLTPLAPQLGKPTRVSGEPERSSDKGTKGQ